MSSFIKTLESDQAILFVMVDKKKDKINNRPISLNRNSNLIVSDCIDIAKSKLYK